MYFNLIYFIYIYILKLPGLNILFKHLRRLLLLLCCLLNTPRILCLSPFFISLPNKSYVSFNETIHFTRKIFLILFYSIYFPHMTIIQLCNYKYIYDLKVGMVIIRQKAKNVKRDGKIFGQFSGFI